MKFDSLKFWDREKKNKEKFEYRHIFSDGSIFIAQLSEEGAVEAMIKKDGVTVLDFQSLLPPGWRMVTQTFTDLLEKTTGQEYVWRGWVADDDNKFICVGSFDNDPKNIFALLHEIGHAQNDASDPSHQELKAITKISKELLRRGTKQDVKDRRRRRAILLSREERRAWAYAILTLRKNNPEIVREIFPESSELKRYIDVCLATYRKSRGEFFLVLDPEFYTDLQKLFDRGQYKKPMPDYEE